MQSKSKDQLVDSPLSEGLAKELGFNLFPFDRVTEANHIQFVFCAVAELLTNEWGTCKTSNFLYRRVHNPTKGGIRSLFDRPTSI